MNKNEAAEQIIRIAPKGQDWTSVVNLAERTDMTPAELAEGLIFLARQGTINLIPESNQKMLTEMDHTYAVWMGGQWKHAFSWM